MLNHSNYVSVNRFFCTNIRGTYCLWLGIQITVLYTSIRHKTPAKTCISSKFIIHPFRPKPRINSRSMPNYRYLGSTVSLIYGHQCRQFPSAFSPVWQAHLLPIYGRYLAQPHRVLHKKVNFSHAGEEGTWVSSSVAPIILYLGKRIGVTSSLTHWPL